MLNMPATQSPRISFAVAGKGGQFGRGFDALSVRLGFLESLAGVV